MAGLAHFSDTSFPRLDPIPDKKSNKKALERLGYDVSKEKAKKTFGLGEDQFAVSCNVIALEI